MSTQPSQHFLDVADGKVYYEVRGSGPLLLVIGQPMTSGPFAPGGRPARRGPHGGDLRPARAGRERDRRAAGR